MVFGNSIKRLLQNSLSSTPQRLPGANWAFSLLLPPLPAAAKVSYYVSLNLWPRAKSVARCNCSSQCPPKTCVFRFEFPCIIIMQFIWNDQYHWEYIVIITATAMMMTETVIVIVGRLQCPAILMIMRAISSSSSHLADYYSTIRLTPHQSVIWVFSELRRLRA